MDQEERIRALKKKDAEVLYWLCRDKSNPQILDKLKIINASTLGYHLTKIYELLGIEGEGEEKRKQLEWLYCGIARQIITQEALETWESVAPRSEEERNRIALVEYKYPELPEDLEQPQQAAPPPEEGGIIKPPPPPVIVFEEGSPIERLWTWRQIRNLVLILCGIIILLSLVIVYLVFFQPPKIALIPAATQIQTPANTQIAVVATQSPPLASTTASPTPTPSQTPTITDTSTPASTSSPTSTFTDTPTRENTPSPTQPPTDTPQPIPPGTLLFQDDFNNGISPQWRVAFGEPIVSQDRLTALEDTWLVVGNSGWRNYKVEFDTKLDLQEQDFIVAFRVNDLDNFDAFKLTDRTIEGSQMFQGQSVQIPDTSLLYAFYLGWQKVTVFVQGDEMSIYVGTEKQTSFNTGKFPNGYVALKIDKFVLIDNVKITSLP